MPNATARLRVVALIAAFNEEDVIGQVIADLIAQGLRVYLIDHASTDATVEEARAHLGHGLLHIERFPDDAGVDATEAGRYRWRSLLARKEALARELDADWFLHHDADELRESPWDGVGLADAIGRVDDAGYNAIDFKALDFVPTHDTFKKGRDLRQAFTHYRPAAWYDAVRINCWKKGAQPVDLASTGGHEVRFPERRVFPVRFLLRHYPIRSQAQGERKIFRERLPRFDAGERAEGWHVQYDAVRAGTSLLADPAALTAFDPGRVRTQLMLERREPPADPNQAALENDLAWFRREWPVREAELLALRARAAELERCAAEAQAAQVASGAERDEVRRQLAENQAQVRELAQAVEALRQSRTWRWSGPLRQVADQLARLLQAGPP